MKKNIVILIVLVLLVSGLGFLVVYAQIKNTIELNGNSNMSIKLNEEYVELGIKGNKNVKISGSVDNTKVGQYTIKYELDDEIIERKVSVVDDIKPEIKLRGSNEIYLYLGNDYVDIDGAHAFDNYDGDITDNIVVNSNVNKNITGTYKIEYKVSDSSKNTSSVERTVYVIDENVSMNKIPILMYHFFYDSSQGETPRDNNWIDVSKFEEQIKYLSDNNYYYPTWNEVEMYLDKKIKLPEKSIVITVDDGDPSFFKYGTKILEKYNVYATSFMVTGWYNPRDYEYDKELLAIESHTHNMHVGGCSGKGLFLCIDHDKGVSDLKDSIWALQSSMAFCYPFGHNNEYTKSILEEVGFHMAVTTVNGKIAPGMDKLTLPRVRVTGTESMNYFIKSIN